MKHARFKIRTLEELRARMHDAGVDLPVSGNLSILGDKVEIAGRIAPNRFAVQPMEGFDSDASGGPGPLSFRRYTRYAKGGFGTIWFEATAVLDEARSNPRQLYLHQGSVELFRQLVEAVRKTAREEFGHEPVLVLQLTHSGRYSKPAGKPRPIIAHHSGVLDSQHGLLPDYPVVSDEYLDRLQDTYVAAAALAAAAGFDGVDVKSCHRYLLSELLASFTREGRYGGSFDNRARMLLETVERIGKEVPGIFVTTRMNAYDAIPYPFGFGVNRNDHTVPDLAEPLELAGRLRRLGIPVLNISIGNPYFNPHYGRPFDFPIKSMPVPDEHPLAAVSRLFEITRSIQASAPGLSVVGSGYSWLRHMLPNVAAGVVESGGATLIGIGRGAFAYPDTPRDILEQGAMDPARCCVACSGCTQIMRDGGMTGCVVRDKEIYGPQYRAGRRFAVDRLREEAARCRDCESAACSAACPAHVDVPGFIKAFSEADIPKAYEILRQANVLPEMCAQVCPSEVQCEGACLENIFCRQAIPIRDIQLVVCRLAREMGVTGVRLPQVQSGRQAVIVGGGPAGTACAIRLLEQGHKVTIMDRSRKLGGVPDSIIPSERYMAATSEISAILEPAVKNGRLVMELGRELGRDVSLEALVAAYDAVLLSPGLGGSASLGRGTGVVDALSFLAEVKNGSRKTVPAQVAVLGGGNTAMDAALAAVNLGATDVYLVYRRSFQEMPAWPAEKEKLVAKGCHCLILTQPLGYERDANGNLTGIRIVRTKLGQPDTSGRRKPSVEPGTESVLGVSLAIEAIGQELSPAMRDALKGIAFTPDGLVATGGPAGSFATSMAKVFAAGDLVSGGTTAVQCVAEGVKAAAEMDVFMGK